MCATRDNFGILASDLSPLLEKDPDEPYPWAVNAIDLDAIADVWRYFDWDAERFLVFLRDRVRLHGRAMCSDELEIVGFFIRHGGLHKMLEQEADRIWLEPTHSSVFDDIYKARMGAGPRVVYEPREPFWTDAREVFGGAKPAVDVNLPQRPARKQGRNELCACGSGKKYKKCHGMNAS